MQLKKSSRSIARLKLPPDSATDKWSVQAEVFKLVTALFDDLVVIDPHVALAGEHIHVRSRLPIRVCLAAVGISERQVHAGKLFVL